ncbi:hypothetical protein VSS74_19030 [Conexibacter stalactiti]|uniref:DUF7144 domain-containing protein n=1 Tax=Conexibacter stalactiti TaxID=1940611 RepID=A0ABU4HWK9_9ACTN|nr:hypothetical protein [Conexibacter stalactiti]MDW5596449.1 hypothetical protein [Conexibacter stalactiti]MEC5037091.1 hypothetical protein [Conexibacter stalactiti]
MGVHATGGGVPASDQTGYATAESHAGGWVVFAGTMLMIAATLNIIYGIGAISDSSFYVNDARYIFSDLNTWGWIVTLTGAAQMLVAFGVWARNTLATWLGIAFAGLNAIIQLMLLPASPFLSLALFAVDMMVIYGLAVHGGHAEERA